MRGKPWSDEETQTLLKMHESDASPRDVANALGCDITRVYDKCRRLGISMRHHREWSASELSKLHKLYKEGKSFDQISAEIGRTSSAVKAKVRTEGILVTEKCKRRWSNADKKRLKDLIYETCSIEKTALKLGRTAKSVRDKMSQFNISLKDAKKHRTRGS